MPALSDKRRPARHHRPLRWRHAEDCWLSKGPATAKVFCDCGLDRLQSLIRTDGAAFVTGQKVRPS